MPNYSRHDVVLVHYPFTYLAAAKVRPAVVVHAPHTSRDLILVPLTSQTASLAAGEFILSDWAAAGLNTLTAAKRGILTSHPKLVIKQLARLVAVDAQQIDQSLRLWLGL